MQPEVVVHADWGTDPKKRVAASARLQQHGGYRIGSTFVVGQTGSPQERLGVPATVTGTVLLGFDFPIGVPAAYAELAGVASFRSALEHFGTGIWRDFYDVCRNPDDIGVYRPFFPVSCPKKGMCTRDDLTSGLGIAWEDLHRKCERKTADRTAGSPLFWTLGGKQVGKAAISGWRDFVQPMLIGGDVGLWPFDGDLADLLQTRSCVIVETYPAELYGHLGLHFPGGKGGGKTSQTARQHLAPRLLSEAEALGAGLSGSARAEIADGFGATRDGEDRFDGMIGLVGMLKHLLCNSATEPTDPSVRRVEGWMLGQNPSVA